jgi:disulfide bond formation protein DsbB
LRRAPTQATQVLTDTPSEPTGKPYFDFISAEFTAEMSRLDSLNDRANRSLSASGSILASFTALAGLALGASLQISGWNSKALVCSFVLLAMSYALGIVGSRVVAYEVATVESLKRMIAADRWTTPTADQMNVVAQQHIATIESLRKVNSTKARQLKIAAWLQLVALVLLAAALLVELIRA